MVETYSHLSPRGRINKIERDIEKERRDATAEFKASVLLAQSSLARLGWKVKELTLGCSNKERSVIDRRYEERLSTAKVAWEEAKYESKSACRAAEKAREAAARLAERGEAADYEMINSRLVKTKAKKKSAWRRCKSALKAAEKAHRTEVGLAEDEQKDALSRPRQDVCNNWDGSESRLERVLDRITSSGHASMERMESINKRMGRAQTLSLSCHECSSEDDIAEMMEEEGRLCQGVLTDVRRMQLASSSGKAPLASRSKKDETTIQRGKAIAEARQKLRILGRYKRDRDATRGRCKSRAKGRKRESHRSKECPTCSHSLSCCGCSCSFCTSRRLEGNDRGREVASSVRREAEKSACVEDEDLVWPTSTPLNDPFDPMPPSLQMMLNTSISEHKSDTPSGVLLGGAGKKGRPPKVGGAKRDGTEEEDSASSRIETRLSTVFCIATAPLLLTRVFGKCCKAMIHAGTRSPLLLLFAIAATMSAVSEAAAVAPSANTDLEKLLSEESSNTYKSHFPVICNSAKCSNFIENLLLLRFLIIIPMVIVVVATRSRNSATAVEVDERGVAGDLDSPVEETEQQIKDEEMALAPSEPTAEFSREDPEKIPVAAAKPAGSNEAEDSRIRSPRGATNLKLTAAEEIAFPMDDEMGEIQGGVRLSRRKLTPSKKKLKNAEIASPMLRSAGKRRGHPKGKGAMSAAAIKQKAYRQRMTDEKKVEVKAKKVLTMRKTRSKRTVEEKEEDNCKRQDAWAGRDPKKKEEHNAKRKKRKEERTPEQVETENAKAKESMRGLREARKAITLDQAGSFDTTMLWEVPGRDFLFNYFQDNPELSVKLWYANNGSWRDREPRMLTACKCLFNKLCSTIDDNGGDADASKQKLRGLNTLCRESIEDKVSLLRVVHERIKENDWKLIKDWQQKKRINNSELAALEWLVTKGLDCDEEYTQLREKRKPAPILDAWARSLIGMQLEVPGWWWTGWRKSDSKKYDCEIVDVEYKDEEKRYFWIYCEEDDDIYPMAYVDVKKYARGVKQKSGRRFDLPKTAHPRPIDKEFEKLCEDALEALEASNHEDDDVIKTCHEFIIKRMDQIVDSQLITPEKQRELGQKFLKAQGRGVSWGKETQGHTEEDLTSVDAPLLTCASCGFRVENNGRDRDVKSLHWAELDDENRSEHLERMEKPPLHLPINDKGEDDIFETWRAYSRWPAKKPDELTKDTTLPDWMFCKSDNGELDRSKPKYFHLHPEFVQEFTDGDGRKDFKARLCGNCCEFEPSEKTKAPMRSIAKGVDFGSPRRVGLVPLTSRERQIISLVRHYQCAVKIERNDGKKRELSHSAIRGHSILFDHDCPRVVKKLLSEESINGSIEIHFVGPDGQYDHLAKKALGSAQVCARSFAVYQWLKVLKDVNEWYSGDEELEDFPVVVERIEKCNKALVEEAVMVTADKKIAKEADIAGDDIREVRVASGRGEAASVNEVSYLLKRWSCYYKLYPSYVQRLQHFEFAICLHLYYALHLLPVPAAPA